MLKSLAFDLHWRNDKSITKEMTWIAYTLARTETKIKTQTYKNVMNAE